MKIGDKVRDLREELNTQAHWVYWIQDGDEAVIKYWDPEQETWVEHSRHAI